MKIFKKTCLLVLISFAVFHPTKAQNSFSIEGEFRPRFEFRDGYKTLIRPDDSPAAFISQRGRLQFNYSNDKIKSRFTIYDYRVWGDQLLKKDIASLGIHEVWTDIKLTEFCWLKIGRQVIQYDNGRLFSGVNWNQIGAAHDGIKISYAKNNLELEVLTTWNQNKENITGTDYIYDGDYTPLFYKNLNAIWLSKKKQNSQFSFLTLIDGYEDVCETDTGVVNNPNKLNYRFTTGLIYKQNFGALTAIARGFYQGGKLYTGQSVSAYYFNLETDYNINAKAKFQLGFELMGGTDHSDAENSKSNAFDILYGARHKFNGHIDYFSIPSTTQRAGLMNPYVGLDYDLGKSWDISLDYHQFYLHKSYLPANPGEKVDNYLGREIDLTVDKKINSYIALCGGYSIIFGSDTLEKIKGGNKNMLNNWAFVMLTIDPTFFTYKNE